MFLDEYQNVPYKVKIKLLILVFIAKLFELNPQVLKYTAGHINYGGRVTDDWDRRCIMNILEGYYNPDILNPEHVYSESGIYHQLEEDSEHAVSKENR